MVRKNESSVSPAAEQRTSVTFTPRFDVWEDDKEYILSGDLPGVDPQDVEVHYERQELRIWGKVAPRHAGREYFLEEYGIGDFYRTFTIGELIDETAISAELKDGVLVVHLLKRAEARPRKIKVKTG
jgi:HSP20 family protein